MEMFIRSEKFDFSICPYCHHPAIIWHIEHPRPAEMMLALQAAITLLRARGQGAGQRIQYGCARTSSRHWHLVSLAAGAKGNR